MSNILIAYAIHFSSFAVQNISKKNLQHVSSIVLFGSVARSETSATSDIDIFVDTTSKQLQQIFKKQVDRFYDSELFKRYWKLLGIKNNINIICDNLSAWPSLRTSIINDGIILYGKYSEPIIQKHPHVLIWWDPIPNQSRRVLLSKQLYGYRIKEKSYTGLLSKIKGSQRLGPNTIMVPLTNITLVKELFERHHIRYRQKLIAKVE